MMQIRYPNITGKTPEERMEQMERYNVLKDRYRNRIPLYRR